jgi:hypothetical protein
MGSFLLTDNHHLAERGQASGYLESHAKGEGTFAQQMLIPSQQNEECAAHRRHESVEPEIIRHMTTAGTSYKYPLN